MQVGPHKEVKGKQCQLVESSLVSLEALPQIGLWQYLPGYWFSKP